MSSLSVSCRFSGLIVWNGLKKHFPWLGCWASQADVNNMLDTCGEEIRKGSSRWAPPVCWWCVWSHHKDCQIENIEPWASRLPTVAERRISCLQASHQTDGQLWLVSATKERRHKGSWMFAEKTEETVKEKTESERTAAGKRSPIYPSQAEKRRNGNEWRRLNIAQAATRRMLRHKGIVGAGERWNTDGNGGKLVRNLSERIRKQFNIPVL